MQICVHMHVYVYVHTDSCECSELIPLNIMTIVIFTLYLSLTDGTVKDTVLCVFFWVSPWRQILVNPKEYTQYSTHGESLKSRILSLTHIFFPYFTIFIPIN
jgi:hypothetical protein